MHTDYDKLLYIKTTNKGMQMEQSPHYNHYEATPYSILYHLFHTYKLEKTDGFVDFGSGKGRLLYYVHHHFGASVTGIEMNEKLYNKTLKNKTKYIKKTKAKPNSIQVKQCYAEAYKIEKDQNVFYFFNPFSVQIFMKVVHNILQSVEENPREVDIILYYPTIDYINYLLGQTTFELIEEIRIPILYEVNNNERFIIFRNK